MGRNVQRVSDSSDEDSNEIQEIARPPPVSKGAGGGTRSRPNAASSSKVSSSSVKVNSQSSNASSSKGKGKATNDAHTKPSKALRKQLQQRPAKQRASSHTAQEDGDGSDDSDDSVVVVASGPAIVVSRGSKRKKTAQSPKNLSAAQSTRIVLSDDETGSSRNGEAAAGPSVRREKQRKDHGKKGKTAVEAIPDDDEEDDDNEATPRKSFLERLEDNATPKFSSAFKARVKSRNDTSIPLADERFESESEDTAYESEDLPSAKRKARPSSSKQASSPRKRKAAEPIASTSESKRPARHAPSTASEEDGDFIVPDDEVVSIHDTESEAPESVENGGKEDAKKDNKQNKRKSRENRSETEESMAPEKQKKEKKKKFKKPKTKYHEPSLQPESEQEMASHFSPPRVAVPSRSSQLSTISSARKKKEKARKRVVASPSESPPPQRQIVSEDDENAFLPSKTSSKRIRKPASRQTQSSSKPLFIGSSDNESDAPAPRKKRAPSPIIDSEDDEAPPPPRRKKGKGKQKASSRMQIDDDEEEDESGSNISEEAPQKKRSKRFEHESSESESSSSSGSSDEDAGKPVSHASSKDSELVDDLKDIELDFNPVKKEKLRPKDLSKGSRLDKLKVAREAKQRKDERRRKGIIESDEDKVKDEEKSGSGESEGSDTSDEDDDQDLDGNVKNFIISDEEMDDDEREQMEKNIPIELTRHGKLELEQHFKVFITYLVYLFFLPRDKRVLKDKYYMFSLEAVRKAVGGVINSSVASSIWKEEFRKALDTRPIYIEDFLDKRPGCDGCSRHDRIASIRSAISGKRYDSLTFEEESGSEDEEQIFELGCFCAERARIHTQLRHFMYHAAQEVFDECRERSRLPAKIPGDREERRKRKDEEAAYVMQQWKDQLSQPPTRLWIELRDLLNLAKIKYVR